MAMRPCAIAFALSLLATAVLAEPPPPAADNRPDAALEAFAVQVGVDLSQKAVLADLAATPRIGLPEIQGCLGERAHLSPASLPTSSFLTETR
jgi:hypothetical protein